ncbi:MAG: sigma-70 family RNA polymerase sigma factor [Pseudomonadota bacterium]
MTGEHDDDETLARAYQNGDVLAFEQLVQRHQDRVYRLAAVWLYDPQRADDATQEVFLRSVIGLRRFRFRAAPFTWLYQTTRNVCREFNRQRAFVPLEDTEAPAQPRATDPVERLDTTRKVQAMIRSLSPRQQEVVMLRLFEQCSVRETAAVMRCREGTVKALLHKAIHKLRSESEQ